MVYFVLRVWTIHPSGGVVREETGNDDVTAGTGRGTQEVQCEVAHRAGKWPGTWRGTSKHRGTFYSFFPRCIGRRTHARVQFYSTYVPLSQKRLSHGTFPFTFHARIEVLCVLTLVQSRQTGIMGANLHSHTAKSQRELHLSRAVSAHQKLWKRESWKQYSNSRWEEKKNRKTSSAIKNGIQNVFSHENHSEIFHFTIKSIETLRIPTFRWQMYSETVYVYSICL